MRIIIKIIVCIFLVLLSYGSLLQIRSEQVIGQLNKKCPEISNRKRIKYTPFVLYALSDWAKGRGMRKDRLLQRILVINCADLEGLGYQFEYLVHIYMTEHEKDSLISVHK